MIKALSIKFSGPFFLIVALFAALSLPARLAAKEGADSFAKFCLVVEEPVSAGSSELKTSAFEKSSKPGPGRKLAFYAESNVDSHVLVAAFNDKDHKLTNHWPPQIVELKALQEYHLPLLPASWNWDQASDASEVQVIFMGAANAESGKLKTLVEAMQNAGSSSQLLNLQTKKLREMINLWMGANDRTAFYAGVVPNAWGAVMRGGDFHWREKAKKVALHDDVRGFLIYRYGG